MHIFFLPLLQEFNSTPCFLLPTSLCRKLKKMYRTMQEEKGKKRASENNEETEEETRPKQQFDKDYVLEPFEGVGSEYMEMSKSCF